MNFFKDLLLVESQLSANKEARHVVNVVNALYSEWKKTGRRKNAADLITTSANKLANIDPITINTIHEATKLKLATLLVRCFDIPYWKSASEKEKLYKKLYPLIHALETYDPRVDSGGNVREVIMTRLSASVAYNSDNKKIFVAYEPKISNTYLRYLFGNTQPERTFRMQSLPLPPNFEELVNVLSINHQKAVDRYTNETTASAKT